MKIKKPSELPSSCLEIYLLLKENIRTGITPEDVTDKVNLNIKSYTARISDLRRYGYHVKNVKRNLYFLMYEPELSFYEVNFILHQAKLRGYSDLQSRCEARIAVMENIL